MYQFESDDPVSPKIGEIGHFFIIFFGNSQFLLKTMEAMVWWATPMFKSISKISMTMHPCFHKVVNINLPITVGCGLLSFELGNRKLNRFLN